MEIITNHQPRHLIYGFELTEKQKGYFDYLDAEELDNSQFFKYKGSIYSLDQFMRYDCDGWHGCHSETYFSAILIKLSDCGEAVTVARCYS